MPASPSLLIVPARFKTGTLYTQIATTSAGVVLGSSGDFNVTRATTATRFNSAGLIESVASGVPRLDYYTSGGTAGCPALLVEAAATNLALHSRDLTNAVWSGTTVTTEKNAVGADGTASGATTITATAASGTVLQALSHASTGRIFSAYIRRVTGTGAIQLTTNGGTNWDTVTITSGYTQVASVARTVASGTVGIRLAVSGDVIEVDFTQGEVGPVATSPNATTSGTVTRNADVITLTGAVSGCIGQTEGTIYAEVDVQKTAAAFRNIIEVTDGTSSNRFFARLYDDSGTQRLEVALINSGGFAARYQNLAMPAGIYKVAFAYALNNFACFVNGIQNGSTDTSGNCSASYSTINLGSAAGNVSFFNDRIRSAALYTTRLTDSELAALTT
jgi:hypothetical protein